jgi:hypothetical protein
MLMKRGWRVNRFRGIKSSCGGVLAPAQRPHSIGVRR